MAEEFRRAGWYPSPDGPGERWWNGASWSDSRRGATAPVPPPVARPDPYAKPVQPTLGNAVTPGATTVDLSQNRPALLAIILGVVGLFASAAGPVAVVFGIIGIQRARRLKAEGKPSSSIAVATIGLALGLVATALLIVAIAGFIASFTVSFGP